MNIRKIVVRSLTTFALTGAVAIAAVPTVGTATPGVYASGGPGPIGLTPAQRCAYNGGEWVTTPRPHCVYY